MTEQFIPPRIRQRAALNISAEEMAGELEVTTEQLVVIESHDHLPRAEDVSRAWDLALGRIVKAREDAVRDEAETSDGPPDTSDALRQWGTGTERADSAPTQAKEPRAKADEESGMSKKAKRSTSRRRRGSK